MIRLTDVHYTAIGRVTVESCTLDRELAEYLRNLGVPQPPRSIGKKLTDFKAQLSSKGVSPAGLTEFGQALRRVRELVKLRNALAHGVWIPDPKPYAASSTAALGGTTVHAPQISAVAEKLRIARKLLLRLCQDHLPQAAKNKKPIAASSSKLLQQL